MIGYEKANGMNVMLNVKKATEQTIIKKQTDNQTNSVKISIHTAVRSYESTTTGKPLLSSRVLYVEES